MRRKAAETLPREGIPPEIMHMVKIINEDTTLDRVQIQKEATPVPGRCQTEAESVRIFETLAPNAVVCERSVEDGVDVVAQRAAVRFANVARAIAAPAFVVVRGRIGVYRWGDDALAALPGWAVALPVGIERHVRPWGVACECWADPLADCLRVGGNADIGSNIDALSTLAELEDAARPASLPCAAPSYLGRCALALSPPGKLHRHAASFDCLNTRQSWKTPSARASISRPPGNTWIGARAETQEVISATNRSERAIPPVRRMAAGRPMSTAAMAPKEVIIVEAPSGKSERTIASSTVSAAPSSTTASSAAGASTTSTTVSAAAGSASTTSSAAAASSACFVAAVDTAVAVVAVAITKFRISCLIREMNLNFLKMK